MKTVLFVATAASAVVASADAGFLGFVASSRNVGAYTVIDVFAGVSNASDKFLNVYNTVSTSSFYQAAGISNKSWKPDSTNFTSTRDSIDSFMTAGTYSGAAYGGVYYASANTNGDPNFTGTSWNTTPAAAAATTIPALAGWYTGDPTSVDHAPSSATAASSTWWRRRSPRAPCAAASAMWACICGRSCSATKSRSGLPSISGLSSSQTLSCLRQTGSSPS